MHWFFFTDIQNCYTLSFYWIKSEYFNANIQTFQLFAFICIQRWLLTLLVVYIILLKWQTRIKDDFILQDLLMYLPAIFFFSSVLYISRYVRNLMKILILKELAFDNLYWERCGVLININDIHCTYIIYVYVSKGKND